MEAVRYLYEYFQKYRDGTFTIIVKVVVILTLIPEFLNNTRMLLYCAASLHVAVSSHL